MKLVKVGKYTLHTDYNLKDFVKFLIVVTLPLGFLVYGVIFYLEEFLVPAMEGFVMVLEITADWIEAEATTTGQQAGEAINALEEPTKESVFSIIDTGIAEVNDKANKLFLAWVAMGLGMLVPIWVVWKISGLIGSVCGRFLKIEETKKLIYETKEVV